MAVQQVIEDRYIDQKRLRDYLLKKFGPGKFSAVVGESVPSSRPIRPIPSNLLHAHRARV